MKAIQNFTQRLYWKNTGEVQWVQPTIWSNGNYGIDELACYRTHNGGGFRGDDAWGAFRTDGGWTGNYGNEYSTTLNIYIAVRNPIRVSGYGVYYRCTDSASDWGSTAGGNFWGSNDNANWTHLNGHGSYGANNWNHQSVSNNTKFKYFRYDIWSHGSGHRDMIQISNFYITGWLNVSVPATEDDYDFYEDVPGYKLGFRDNKYYGLG